MKTAKPMRIEYDASDIPDVFFNAQKPINAPQPITITPEQLGIILEALEEQIRICKGRLCFQTNNAQIPGLKAELERYEALRKELGK